jgi:hypothetical protein
MAKKRAFPEPKPYRVKNLKKYRGDATMVTYRSSWEKKMMIWFDTHPNVIEWSSEETVIPYISPLDGQPHRYFMDFKATFQVGKVRKTYLVEVKPYEQTQPPKITERKKTKTLLEQAATYKVNQAKWEAAEEYCRQKGWGFQIITEYELGMAE